MEKNLYLKEEKLYSAFKLFDTDGDGTITSQELQNVLGQDEDYKDKDEKFWQELVKEADLNDDGKVIPFPLFLWLTPLLRLTITSF